MCGIQERSLVRVYGFESQQHMDGNYGHGKEVNYLGKTHEERDFPGGPVVKNPPSNAGDVGSIPGWGTKIPHAAGQLSPCAATPEPARSAATSEKPVRHNEEPACGS